MSAEVCVCLCEGARPIGPSRLEWPLPVADRFGAAAVLIGIDWFGSVSVNGPRSSRSVVLRFSCSDLTGRGLLVSGRRKWKGRTTREREAGAAAAADAGCPSDG